MSQAPPFRQRPNLHLALTQLTGSPRRPNPSTPSTTPLGTPARTPLGTTAYSPFRSAGVKAPTPYSSTPSPILRRPLHSSYDRYSWFRIKRYLFSRPTGLFLMILALTIFWFNGGREEIDAVKMSARGFGKDILQEKRMQDFQFYPATNPKIHYIGRWTATPNHLRKDGTFPGVYFDVTVRNTTSLFLALHNRPKAKSPDAVTQTLSAAATPTHGAKPGHLSFRPFPANQQPALPISLLARLDDEEYVLLPNSTSLVSVSSRTLAQDQDHHVRIVAPMIDDAGRGVVELEGLWLSKGGMLVKVPGSILSEEYVDEDSFRAENPIVGEKHRNSLNEIEKGGVNRFSHSQFHRTSEEDLLIASKQRRKVLEVITDSPGSFTRKQRGLRTGGGDGLLAGVMGWEYLLGEMFKADHVGIGVDGMCLVQDCIGGTGFPAGMGDVFFRSGPYGSEYFEYSWPFSGYIPDVLVLNLGDSDYTSFVEHQEKYGLSLWDLTEKFESTYVSLIKGIRRLGYPKHPAVIHSEQLGSPGVIPTGSPATIPIFVMRPLRGQMEQATQNVVGKLRLEGDKSVFWLDTSGWLDADIEAEDPGDFFLDKSVRPHRWRLSEQGNQRVAIFLHTHVCRYLARVEDRCAFLPPEVYQGTVYDPEEAHLNQFLEKEKERKLRKLFWEDEDEDSGDDDGDVQISNGDLGA